MFVENMLVVVLLNVMLFVVALLVTLLLLVAVVLTGISDCPCCSCPHVLLFSFAGDDSPSPSLESWCPPPLFLLLLQTLSAIDDDGGVGGDCGDTYEFESAVPVDSTPNCGNNQKRNEKICY